jgi:hypothetical protein
MSDVSDSRWVQNSSSGRRNDRWHEKVESDPGGNKLPRSKALKVQFGVVEMNS